MLSNRTAAKSTILEKIIQLCSHIVKQLERSLKKHLNQTISCWGLDAYRLPLLSKYPNLSISGGELQGERNASSGLLWWMGRTVCDPHA